jgi:2-hydroxychromene-2-carboxylate isomerase
MTTVDFYLGLGSRYSYLAASQLDRIERQHNCRFVWKPIASGALIDRRGSNPFRGKGGAGQYDRAYREYDAKAWAAHYGIPFHEPAAFKVPPELPALACLAADRQAALVRCCRLLFQMIFGEGVALDDAAIARLPARLDLDAAAFRRDISAAETRARHGALLEEAAVRGAFGVPTFFVGEHMFWGNDRLPLLEAALRRAPLPAWRREV